MTLFFALVGGAGLIGPSAVDFTLLSPLPLAVALFVAIPAAYGATMPWIAERLLREDSILRTGRWAWIVGLVPLLFANIVGALVLLVALGVWAIGRSTPELVDAWRSKVVTWLGRAALVAVAFASGLGPRPRWRRHPRLIRRLESRPRHGISAGALTISTWIAGGSSDEPAPWCWRVHR